MEVVLLSKTDVYSGNYSIAKRDATHEFLKEMHYHNFYEMQFYLRGSEGGRIGRTTTNSKTRKLTQRYMILINISDVYQVNTTCKAPYTRYRISSDSGLLLFACSNASNLLNISSHCVDVKYSQSLTPAQITTFVSTCNKHEHLTVRRGRDIMEKSLILKTSAHIYDIFYDGQEISATDSRSLAVATELVNYIDASVVGDLSLGRLTERVNSGAFHLSRMLKRYIGTALSRYIITKRIDKVKLSLKSQVPTTMVGRGVGFNSYNHFCRAFKSVAGINPTKYKEVMEKKKQYERL